jgi:hypothetical protein
MRGNYCVLLCVALLVSGCKISSPKTQLQDLGGDDRLNYCLAIRGNGDRINSTLHSMARIIEEMGRPEAVAGGSSASIAAFLLESILQNPVVLSEGNLHARNAKIGLLLKSFWGYLDAVRQQSLGTFYFGLGQISKSDRPVESLSTLVETNESSSILNYQEIKRILNGGLNPLARVKLLNDLKDQIRDFGAFDSSQIAILFKPALVDFDEFARLIGVAGDFYAGQGDFYDRGRVASWLTDCSSAQLPRQDRYWNNVSGIQTSGGQGNCGDTFRKIVQNYLGEYHTRGGQLPFRRRIDQPIGGTLRSLISTSIIQNQDEIDKYFRAKDLYWKGLPIIYDPDFSQVRFGYWGRKEDIVNLQANRLRYDDEKTRRMVSLLGDRNDAPWFEAIRTSPAEPGLANPRLIEGVGLSVGGWSDLQPISALNNIGCSTTIYVTRAANHDSLFARGMVKILGGSDEMVDSIFGRENWTSRGNGEFSSSQKSLNEASGAWCTHWDDIDTSPASVLERDAYTAKMYARASLLNIFDLNIVDDSAANVPGCTSFR